MAPSPAFLAPLPPVALRGLFAGVAVAPPNRRLGRPATALSALPAGRDVLRAAASPPPPPAQPAGAAAEAAAAAADGAPPAVDVPMSVDAVVTEANTALTDALTFGGGGRGGGGGSGGGDGLRLRVDVLCPGLAPAVEEQFPLSDALLYGVALRLAAALAAAPRSGGDGGDGGGGGGDAATPDVRVLFGSAGGAASAAKHYADAATPVPSGVTLGSLSPREVGGAPPADGGAASAGPPPTYLVVAPTNARGDPVVRTLGRCVAAAAPGATWVLLNPRLASSGGDGAGGTGLAEAATRRALLGSFATAYYFRNVFVIERPRLVAREAGVILKRGARDDWVLAEIGRAHV